MRPEDQDMPLRKMPRPDAVDGFRSITVDATQHIMSFLSVQDRFALMRTQKSLYEELPLVTTFASYCGVCGDCESKNQHLCKAKDNQRPASFWTCVLVNSAGQLTELRLADCENLTPAVLDADSIERVFSSLRVLDLNRCSTLGQQGLAYVAHSCKNLTELHLRDMVVDASTLALFLQNNHKTLRVVNLQGCHTLKGDEVRQLAICQDLKDLSLNGCHNVDNAAIVYIVEQCKSLRRINLRYCHKVDDKVVAAVALHLPDLKDLNLRYCYKISDKAVETICTSLVKLEHLNLSQCSKITDISILRIVASLAFLKELRLWGCTKLTSASVYAISIGLPSLTLVDIRSRDKLEAVIGGPTALKFLIQTYRNTLAAWEQAGQVGVFKRPLLCALAA